MPVSITKIKLRDRIFLIGPPGIGKSVRIRELAEEEAKARKKKFIDIGEIDNVDIYHKVKQNPEKYYLYWRIIAPKLYPEDLYFHKRIDQNTIDFLLPWRIKLLTIRGVEGTWFIDEFTNIPYRQQRTMWYSIIQEREIGFYGRISEKIKLVLAGNPPEISSDAEEISSALANRVDFIEVKAPNVKEWGAWMHRKYGDEWVKETLAYLLLFPADIIRLPDTNAVLENFPTPRSWTQTALALYEEEYHRHRQVDEWIIERVIGYLGKEVGGKFISFLKVKVFSIEELMQNPEIVKNLRGSTLALTASHIAQKLETLLKTKDGLKLLKAMAKLNRELLVMVVKMANPDVIPDLVEKLEAELEEVADKLKDYVVV